MSSTAARAARASGVVVALGYLSGAVDGPVVAVMGALALITFGRTLVASRQGLAIFGGAFAVLAGASGVCALRWGTLELADLRGIQGVLGPTFLVEPLSLGLAAAVALAGGIVALGVWLAEPVSGAEGGLLWRWGETAAIALSLAAFFAGPQMAGAVEVFIWIGATAAIAALGEGVAVLLRARSIRARAAVLGGAGLCTGAAALVVGAVV